MSNALVYLLASHVDCTVICDRYCSCGVWHPDGYAVHLAEVIAAGFLVVPRSEITGTEYGYQHLPDSGVFVRQSAELVRGRVTEIREAQQRRGIEPLAVALSRPILPWSPLPEGMPDGA